MSDACYVLDNRRGVATDAARSHILFGVVDYVAREVHGQGIKFKKLEEEIASVKNLQLELKQLMMDVSKSSFSLKEHGYEVSFSGN